MHDMLAGGDGFVTLVLADNDEIEATASQAIVP